MPSFGLLLALVGTLGVLLSKLPGGQGRRALTMLLVVYVAYLSGLTWMRSNHFADRLKFSIMEAEYHPSSPRANLAAAVAMMDAGYGLEEDYSAQAIRFHLTKAIDLDANAKDPYLYMIIWACSTNRAVENTWIESLEQRMQSSPFAPSDVELAGKFSRVVMGRTDCLTREQVRRVFLGAAERSNISNRLRAQFLESLADYELVVSRDPASARALLGRALKLMPSDRVLADKLAGYSVASEKERVPVLAE